MLTIPSAETPSSVLSRSTPVLDVHVCKAVVTHQGLVGVQEHAIDVASGAHVLDDSDLLEGLHLGPNEHIGSGFDLNRW